MAEAQAGETVLMTFTLPESRRGEWMTGWFLPGHYEAGMHGMLTAYGAKKRPRLGRCWSSLPSSLRLCRLRCSSSSSRSLAG